MYQIDGVDGGHKKVDYNTREFWNTISHKGDAKNAEKPNTNQ